MVNPAFFTYNNIVGIDTLAKPTAIFIAHTNRLDPAFQVARSKGAEVYGYFNLNETPDSRVSTLWEQFYMGDSTSVPRWPGNRINWPGTHMLDLRVGSAWANYAVDHLSQRMTDGVLDGFFLDVIGGRLWGSESGWAGWSLQERQDWQAGVVDILRRLDQARRQLNPSFVIVNNNRWYDSIGKYFVDGEKYVNGICIEGHDPRTNQTVVTEAARAFGVPGKRRVLTVNKDQAMATAWITSPGITHVSYAPTGYGTAGSALTSYSDLRISEMQALIDQLRSTTNELEVAANAAIAAKVAAEAQAAAAVQAKQVVDNKLNQIKVIVNG